MSRNEKIYGRVRRNLKSAFGRDYDCCYSRFVTVDFPLFLTRPK